MELFYQAERDEKICLMFYPCLNKGEDMAWEDWHSEEALVVYKSDYRQLLLGYLTAIFPLVDPTNGEMQDNFDVYFGNWIGRKDWQRLLKAIGSDLQTLTDAGKKEFYQQFLAWSDTQLQWADMIVIESNL